MLQLQLIGYTQGRAIREKDRSMAEPREFEVVPGSLYVDIELQLPNGEKFTASVANEDFAKKIIPALKGVDG